MWKPTTGKLILGLQLARPTPCMSIEKRELWQIIFLTIIQLMFIYIDAATVLARIRETFMSVPLPELSEVFVRQKDPSNRFK